MFDRVQVWALAGPLKDIQTCPKATPALFWLSAEGFVLLEGEPSPQSEVLSALEQVFIKDVSVLFSVHIFLGPDKSATPCH